MLDILYQDNECIAVNKPAGMLVHRSWLDRRETHVVVQTLRDQVGRRVFPVHRLDRPTSGVLLFAFDSRSARALTQQFEHKTARKTYWAVVRGHLPDADTIDYPLKYQPDQIAEALTEATVQEAVSSYRCLARIELPFQSAVRYPTSRYSWAELEPHTGRKHQLRRHLKHIFHPIVGDTNYGDLRQNHAVSEHLGTQRLMLHARSLCFENLQGEAVEVTAPTDEQWAVWLAHFGNPQP
ncbi:tRNA pseudouridine(65) synthase TruC [Bergeriella denitrificans]|uniref:tRNA pseudouridine synthase C n=1 Tax=Bergeriella denitrificans TaxID=494 RepID=A0A378UIU5_BERDE|nr:tRNA pseudouridine(65) synthase TruC [Bergeriella denitrificans]STZ77304.1 putative psedouridine synthase [Bergeriella denitrificans]